MKRIAIAVCVMILLPVVFAQEQSPVPKPAPELRNRDLWVGDWTMVGTAKDTPAEPEYKLDWSLHGSRILGGFFVQIDQIWKGNGPEQLSLEILSYDPIKGTHISSGFQSDGATWVATATYNDGTAVETGTSTTADGKIIKWRGTWVFSADRMAVSAIQESDQDGVRWTSFTINGIKAKTPERTR